jgi:hypothetical protein
LVVTPTDSEGYAVSPHLRSWSPPSARQTPDRNARPFVRQSHRPTPLRLNSNAAGVAVLNRRSSAISPSPDSHTLVRSFRATSLSPRAGDHWDLFAYAAFPAAAGRRNPVMAWSYIAPSAIVGLVLLVLMRRLEGVEQDKQRSYRLAACRLARLAIRKPVRRC